MEQKGGEGIRREENVNGWSNEKRRKDMKEGDGRDRSRICSEDIERREEWREKKE